jgi:hypothetical protein
MSIYAVGEHYGLSTWYEHSGAYDLNVGTDLLLSLTGHIVESDAYFWQGIAFPQGDDVQVAPQTTFSGTVVMPPYSYIVGLTGYSGAPFALRIYDKGAQTDLYYRQWAFHKTVASDMQLSTVDPTGQTFQQDVPFGPYLFRDPLIVLPPGVLQIQVTNTDIETRTIPIQLLFSVAVPKSTLSLNKRKVLFPSDPSGVQSQQQAPSPSSPWSMLMNLPNIIGG